MKVPFDTIWEVSENRIANKIKIRCGGLTAEAYAFRTTIDRPVFFGGIDWTLFLGRQIEIESDGDVAVIKGIY